MASYMDEISLCHFAPITRNIFQDKPTDGWFYCSHCGAEARNVLYLQNQTPGDKMELAARRFKDGAIDWDELADIISKAMFEPMKALAQSAANLLQGDAPPVWRWNGQYGEWVKETSSNNNGPDLAESTDVKGKLSEEDTKNEQR